MDFLKAFVIISVLLCFFVISPDVIAVDDSVPGHYTIVYYFRANLRCSNCYKIEQYTTESIDKFFAGELESGELVYKVINIDEEENRHFVDDYGLYTKSVVVSQIKDGKELDYKNLVKIWEYLENKESFYGYIKDEVSIFLNKAREKQ